MAESCAVASPGAARFLEGAPSAEIRNALTASFAARQRQTKMERSRFAPKRGAAVPGLGGNAGEPDDATTGTRIVIDHPLPSPHTGGCRLRKRLEGRWVAGPHLRRRRHAGKKNGLRRPRLRPDPLPVELGRLGTGSSNFPAGHPPIKCEFHRADLSILAASVAARNTATRAKALSSTARPDFSGEIPGKSCAFRRDEAFPPVDCGQGVGGAFPSPAVRIVPRDAAGRFGAPVRAPPRTPRPGRFRGAGGRCAGSRRGSGRAPRG